MAPDVCFNVKHRLLLALPCAHCLKALELKVDKVGQWRWMNRVFRAQIHLA